MHYNTSTCSVYELNRILALYCTDDDEDKEHEFGKLVAEHLTEIHLGTTPDKLNKVIHAMIYHSPKINKYTTHSLTPPKKIRGR